MNSFVDAIGDRVLVCDGAMGSMLYARGAFVNRPFDELNALAPDQVLDVHRAYVSAGADVLQTNTFGANRLRLSGFGLGDRLVELNRAAVRLARQAAGSTVFVAGAVGPLGVSVEALGRTAPADTMECFGEQAGVLAEAGVDLLVLETFRTVVELEWAVRAVRAVTDLPVVAQMAFSETGDTEDGVAVEAFVSRLIDAGATVVGANCGPDAATLLGTLQRLHAADPAVPLSVQPNVGVPREIDGRMISMSSPDHLASYARRFVDCGVRLVGGCCGTTPVHIERMAASLAA